MTVNEWFPERTSITVDDAGRLVLKVRSGEPFRVANGDIEEFLDLVKTLDGDIRFMAAQRRKEKDK